MSRTPTKTNKATATHREWLVKTGRFQVTTYVHNEVANGLVKQHRAAFARAAFAFCLGKPIEPKDKPIFDAYREVE